jgi:hypothetical protein
MFDPLRFLTPSYLFDVNPSGSFISSYILLIFFGLLLLAAIVILVLLRVKKFAPPLKKILRPLPGHLEIFALVGIFLVLFRLSAAYYLSMRFWLLVWFIAFIWYIVLLSQKVRLYPKQLQEHLRREEAHQYAPVGKKKRHH